MNTSTSTTAPRRDRLLREHIHDPCKTKRKLLEPSVCRVCRAVFRDGRWQWAASRPQNCHETICQACRRTKDGYPAGVIKLSGLFAMEHRADILNLIHHVESMEKAEHPMHRLMKIEQRPDSILISTTDNHLPQRIGEALRRSFKGALRLRYGEESYFVRVNWTREE